MFAYGWNLEQYVRIMNKFFGKFSFKNREIDNLCWSTADLYKLKVAKKI